MSRVRLTRQAERDIDAIWDYIGIVGGNPDAADTHATHLHTKFLLYAKQPRMGRARDELRPHLRSFPVGNYVVFYYPSNDGIDVVGVIHGAQDVPGIFEDR